MQSFKFSMANYSIPNALPKFSLMVVPAAITVSSPSFTLIASQQRITVPRKLSVKATKTLSPTSPPTLSSSASMATSPTAPSRPLKKVLVPIGFGTEEMEAVILVDVLRQAGAAVTVASVESELEIEASGGMKLVADTLISSCSNEVFDLVALPLMDSENDCPRKEEFNKVDWSVDHTPRVLIPIANGSQGIELVTIADILRRAKVDVVIASVEKSLQILTSTGTKVVADKLIKEAVESTYDLIILPGGAAADERFNKSRVLKKMLKEQDSAKRIYGAVCSSPAVLFKQGLLKDKRAIAHPSLETESTLVDTAKVIIDGKLITSKGFYNVIDFALAVVSKLFGHARARSVAEGLVFEYPRVG